MPKDKILELWQDGCERNAKVKRVVEEPSKEDFIRKSHGYERSQCRTTHKRQDC